VLLAKSCIIEIKNKYLTQFQTVEAEIATTAKNFSDGRIKLYLQHQ